ncbi:DUF1127 domain-containing protein [Bradyrhizobium sp. 24]|uniref:DUF1127 domain-containing protein n=1 Tax=unclassified Bradyrhizobium TaxID=2631580 RepID=UPI001FF82EC1|nr:MULTISPECIES: DUF1127 domain-containing protein [unclassified Bradyrhizobium]MCK1304004.1 DUF1127 domain-containing protein [Bradyrhizobium sp. 37]MCK1382566.1 DUF1127 domain-containing protein [Bradyrhizobium sp. 24]MCK1775145.1 DUF1127 domain-containing protein [Bradyrhizobium sp. 134]
MSVIYGAAWMRRPFGSTQRVVSLVQQFLSTWRERRRRRRAQATLRGLSDRELMDIGTTRGEIDYIASHRDIARQNRSTERDVGVIALLLCGALILAFASEAKAQCTAQDVLRNHLDLKTAPPVQRSQTPVSSAADVRLWKTIAIGTFRDMRALRKAMSAMGCDVGSAAAEVLARPAFTLSGKKTDVQLVPVSAAELGFKGETASLTEIYARAQRLGFGLAPAEIAPQLRLQYLDQPIGEFLIIGMEPIRTWAGEPVILTVANGGAGLILIGQGTRENAEIPVNSTIVFVRPSTPAPAETAAFK